MENENHCDFTRLREMLIRTNMEDLCDATHARHYELYRKDRLKQMGFEEGDKEGKASSFAETYTMRRESHLQSLQEREEEMRQKFVLRCPHLALDTCLNFTCHPPRHLPPRHLPLFSQVLTC